MDGDQAGLLSSGVREQFPVVLVSMPWAPPIEPSLGLAILKSSLAAAGVRSRVYHASSALLEWVTYQTHGFVASFWGANEFVFTADLDPDPDERQLEALVSQARAYAIGAGHPHYSSPEKICDLLLTLRNEIIPKYLRQTVDRILGWNPRIVGLTCMFDQTIASVAVAKLLKERKPEIRVVLGGYGLEGPPGDVVLDAFPWIDWLVRGDGEQPIVDLAKQAIATDASIDPIKSPRLLRGRLSSLEDSPTPDYDDWFKDIENLRIDHSITIEAQTLRVESSRGCWWGQKKHCIFCGIDDDSMSYRYKSPETVLMMLSDLRSKYGSDMKYCFADYIFPKAYYSALLPRLSEVSPKYRLWCEIKANQTSDRVKQFSAAGFVGFQPGVESFSTQVLRSMDKGVRGIDNVALLKRAYENRLVIDYNVLFGLPDDERESYEEMLSNVPLLYHLMPPVSRTETIVTRFAPLQSNPERFGIKSKATHHKCYNVLFSEGFKAGNSFRLDDYCYYFERNFDYAPGLASIYKLLVDEINHWKNQHVTRSVFLLYDVREGGNVTVDDSRYGEAVRHNLSPAASAAYLACTAAPTNRARLEEAITATGTASEPSTQNALDELRSLRLVWEEGTLVLGLATPGEITRELVSAEWKREWSGPYV